MNLDWTWLQGNVAAIASLLGQHALLALIPVVVALVLALPLGFLVSRTGRAAPAILAVLGLVSSIPALALFVALPILLGTSILSPLNVVVALTVYSTALLVRSVADGLRAVPATVRQSASAIGFGWWRRVFRVELPLALPTVFVGLRVVTVSNIALVSVAVLVGTGALGQLFVRGYASTFYTPLVAGLVLSVLLALLADLVLLLLQRRSLPWVRARRTA
ncbi:MAG: putative osmoprotectant transporter permease protein [Friedmanniella sp.]|nr:putative osmoprotectant transporter permease protein [Friedmanniella sp.]